MTLKIIHGSEVKIVENAVATPLVGDYINGDNYFCWKVKSVTHSFDYDEHVVIIRVDVSNKRNEEI